MIQLSNLIIISSAIPQTSTPHNQLNNCKSVYYAVVFYLKLIAGGGEHFVQLFADFVAAEGLFVHNGYCGQLYFLYAIGERCRLAVADFELRHGSLGGVGHHNGAG